MTALFVKQLTTLDFSYLCPVRGLVGETWLVDVTLSGELDDQGMVFDFGHVKKQVKASLDTLADHRLLVPVRSSSTTVSCHGDQLTVNLQMASGFIQCQSPSQAILLVDSTDITPEGLRLFLEQTLLQELPDNVAAIDLHLYPEPIDGAYYHYSHGLKKHLGNCQRIAHGHRSSIEIYINEQRQGRLEQQWSDIWRDIYIATREDLKDTFHRDGVNFYQFSYTSDQGYFELIIPSDRCYLVDTDSTVELLAQHMAQELTLTEGQPVRVVAYEGFNKGASAHSQVSL